MIFARARAPKAKNIKEVVYWPGPLARAAKRR